MPHGVAVEAALPETLFQSPATSLTLIVSRMPGGGGGGRLGETRDWVVRTDYGPNRRRREMRREPQAVSGDSEGEESVPRGAGDEEAHVVQRPPGPRLRLGLLRALGRRELRLRLGLGLGLHGLGGTLATAQLSAHGLQEERPVRSRASRTPPRIPPRPSPGAGSGSDLKYSSAGLHAPLACAVTPGRAGAVTSARTLQPRPPVRQGVAGPRGRAQQTPPHLPAIAQSRPNFPGTHPGCSRRPRERLQSS